MKYHLRLWDYSNTFAFYSLFASFICFSYSFCICSLLDFMSFFLKKRMNEKYKTFWKYHETIFNKGGRFVAGNILRPCVISKNIGYLSQFWESQTFSFRYLLKFLRVFFVWQPKSSYMVYKNKKITLGNSSCISYKNKFSIVWIL